MKVLFLGAFFVEPYCPHWKGIMQAGKSLFGKKVSFLDIRSDTIQEIMDKVIIGKFDYIVFCLSDCVENQSLAEFCSKHSKVIFWYCDSIKIKLNYSFGQYLTAFFLSNKTQLTEYQDEYKIEHSYFLPQACYYDFNPFSKFKKEEQQDIVFIGRIDRDFHKERTELLDKLNEIKSITVINSDTLEERIKIYERMPSIYTSSNFSLSLNHNNTLEGYCSNRPFNILGMGGVLLIQDFPGINELFPLGTCVRFEDENEFNQIFNKEKFIPELKERLKNYSWQYAIRNHTYLNRLFEMFSIVRGL